ncbi:MAG: sigma 54-interacting transcriptional regulator, partial [Syntrophales bacterium]|nr:sigma 54-interacting transcriptional regulator [Syntrophales bacterium]
GHSYAQAGQINQAPGMLDALQKYAEEIGDYHSQCYALGNIGMIMLNIGKLEEAARYHEDCVELSKREHNRWMTYSTTLSRAYIEYLKGNYDRAAAILREFDQLRAKMEVYVSPVPAYFMELCWAMEQGIVPYKADYCLAEEIKTALQGENLFVKGLAYRYAAFMKEKEGESYEEIMELLDLSVQWLDASGAFFEAAKSKAEQARRLLVANDIPKARNLAIEASGILSDNSFNLVPKELRRLIGEETSGRSIALDEILKLGQEIANIRESRTLVLKIISVVNRITGAERGAIFLLGDGRLQLKASQNLTQTQIADPGFALAMKMIEEVAKTGQGCIREMDAENMFHPLYSDAAIQSMICVPMILRGQVTGVLYHDNRLISSAFTRSDLDLLAYFSAQAAVSLENVTAYEKIQLLNQRLSLEKEYLEEQYKNRMHWGNIIGNSPAIKKVMNQIQKVAKTGSSVLILGETGVGKELVANAVHQNSLHNDKPFIVVQCSALPENLIQSELFGHEKGSFTGAIKRRTGRLELAHGGTLFMDEIGDLSLEVQVRLLRVLQTKRFERVGGNETLQSDFRLIAATNRDLEKAVREGRFREDLYYRLNVFPIHVPALRERKDDIALLAHHFLAMHSKKLGKDFREIHEDVLAALIQYDWPGNIREMENTIERAMILNQPPLLKMIDLPSSPRDAGGTIPTSPDDMKIALTNDERKYILQALEQSNGRINGPGGAAELLQLNPSTLRFRIKKLGIKNQRS